ncbi:MAG: putative quinol monooxygenase [Gammaproteobacteria bacterium]|nr:putative quinol monooxygenase [Gammaproteobacteria bacterium]
MLTFIARMKVKEGKEQEFIELVTELTEKVLANEPDTKIYQFYRLRDVERSFAVIESFTSEAAEKAHLETPYFNDIVPGITECLDGTYTREYLDPLAS